MEFHQLELQKQCRVCGKRLCKAKSKATVYPCIQHQDSLLKCFGIDMSQDDSTIHPLKLCNPCYSVTRRWAKALADGVHYTHSVQPIDWSPHTESGCLVRRVVLYVRNKYNGVIIRFANILSTPQVLEGRRR